MELLDFFILHVCMVESLRFAWCMAEAGVHRVITILSVGDNHTLTHHNNLENVR
jgi:hypothetical protein